MPPKKTKTKKKGKKYHLELSHASIFFWSLGLFFLLAWFFVLGIFVGRGFLPEGVKTISELRASIAKLPDMAGNKESSDLDLMKSLDREPEFSFYDELSTKKEAAAKKSQSSGKKREGPTKLDKWREPSKTGVTYTVQIASLKSEIKALKVVNRLVDLGYRAYYSETRIKGTTHYRVRCGKFKTEKEALNLKTALAQNERLNGFVTRVEE